MKNLLALLVLIFSVTLNAQELVGKWKTIDDETNKERSIVEIWKDGNGTYYGKVNQIFFNATEDKNPKCTKCDPKDPRYNKPTIGMIIIRGMKKDGDEYSGGYILDPKKGTEYKCKMWIEDGKLMVRGYLGWFYRTQTWLPYKE